uniref:Uncharacterized protein n=1 Tax=Arundo donax TaxID=35708 RepID=A0A0A9CJ91_ARUDO
MTNQSCKAGTTFRPCYHKSAV